MELNNWIMESYNFAASSVYHFLQLIKTQLYFAKISPHDFYFFAFLFNLY